MFVGFDDRRGENLPLLKEVKICMKTRDCWGHELDDSRQYIDHVSAYFDGKGIEFG
jgi:hypothetical protein